MAGARPCTNVRKGVGMKIAHSVQSAICNQLTTHTLQQTRKLRNISNKQNKAKKKQRFPNDNMPQDDDIKYVLLNDDDDIHRRTVARHLEVSAHSFAGILVLLWSLVGCTGHRTGAMRCGVFIYAFICAYDCICQNLRYLILHIIFPSVFGPLTKIALF